LLALDRQGNLWTQEAPDRYVILAHLEREGATRLRLAHLMGLFLWRGGLLLVGAWALFEGARWLLRFIHVPAQIEVGLGLLVAGMALVLLSLVLERVHDARAEGDLSE
jgi:hypothetical protein